MMHTFSACARIVGLTLLYMGLGVLMLALIWLREGSEWPVSWAVAECMLFIGLAAAMCWWYARIYRRENRSGYFADGSAGWRGRYVLYALLYAAAMIGSGYLHGSFTEWFTGRPAEESTNQQALIEMVAALPVPIMVVHVVLVAPILEEILFRGLFFNCWGRLDNLFKRITVLLVSSALFAMLHGELPGSLNFLPYFAMGLLLGTAYLHTRDLRYPIFAHMATNAVGIALIYYDLHGW